MVESLVYLLRSTHTHTLVKGYAAAASLSSGYTNKTQARSINKDMLAVFGISRGLRDTNKQAVATGCI